MILNHRHTGLIVKNLNKSIKFYEGLGLKLKQRRVEVWDDHILKIAKMGQLELVQGQWRPHLCFEVDEIPDGKIITAKYRSGHSVVFMEDPDGNLIEFFSQKEGDK
jgi:catechol 2,3-dioxygenase-like lactoylglutathione lyase family enzyme